MRREIPHNTPEQVVEYLRAALAAVDEAEIPDELRAAAFNQAVALIAAKQIIMEEVAPSGILANIERNRR